jgi:MYXO-CTERM domain-containing protein
MMRRSVFAVAAAGLVLACAAPAQFAAAGITGATATQHQGTVQRAAAGFPTMNGFKLPYSDPNQAGLLTLCNEHDQPITHGSLSAVPFVWRVVSSVPTPSAWRKKGVTATLFGFQPRPYTPAGAWSGGSLTASSLYSNFAHPMVQETPIDQPLTQITNAYPPIWDHLIELRVYLGAPDSEADVMQYGAADLQISGNSWTMVEGGTSGCTSGTAVSREVLDGMPGAAGMPKPGATKAPGAASGSSTSPTPAAGSSSHPATVQSANAASSAGHNSSAVGGVAPTAIGIGVAVVVVLAAIALWRSRRRRTGF